MSAPRPRHTTGSWLAGSSSPVAAGPSAVGPGLHQNLRSNHVAIRGGRIDQPQTSPVIPGSLHQFKEPNPATRRSRHQVPERIPVQVAHHQAAPHLRESAELRVLDGSIRKAPAARSREDLRALRVSRPPRIHAGRRRLLSGHRPSAPSRFTKTRSGHPSASTSGITVPNPVPRQPCCCSPATATPSRNHPRRSCRYNA